MVEFKGITISVITPSDIQRLPEFSKCEAFDQRGRTVACYIPVLKGSQFWFEYSIEGPHPSKAAYLFKLFINGEHITNWDCTSKHAYHGKVAYSLQSADKDAINSLGHRQQSFQFVTSGGRSSPTGVQDAIEIKIHRIEHRCRITTTEMSPSKSTLCGSIIKLQDSGFLTPDRPVRRYKYQLLDPIQEPYAIFRFYCRTYEYLERHNILSLERSLNPSLSASSSTSTDVLTDVQYHHKTQVKPSALRIKKLEQESRDAQQYRTVSQLHRLPLTQSEASPSTITKDSVEELTSNVPRSPQSTQSTKSHPRTSCTHSEDEIDEGLGSPQRSSRRSRVLQKKKRTEQENPRYIGDHVKTQSVLGTESDVGLGAESFITERVEMVSDVKKGKAYESGAQGQQNRPERRSLVGMLGKRITSL